MAEQQGLSWEEILDLKIQRERVWVDGRMQEMQTLIFKELEYKIMKANESWEAKEMKYRERDKKKQEDEKFVRPCHENPVDNWICEEMKKMEAERRRVEEIKMKERIDLEVLRKTLKEGEEKLRESERMEKKHKKVLDEERDSLEKDRTKLRQERREVAERKAELDLRRLELEGARLRREEEKRRLHEDRERMRKEQEQHLKELEIQRKKLEQSEVALKEKAAQKKEKFLLKKKELESERQTIETEKKNTQEELKAVQEKVYTLKSQLLEEEGRREVLRTEEAINRANLEQEWRKLEIERRIQEDQLEMERKNIETQRLQLQQEERKMKGEATLNKEKMRMEKRRSEDEMEAHRLQLLEEERMMKEKAAMTNEKMAAKMKEAEEEWEKIKRERRSLERTVRERVTQRKKELEDEWEKIDSERRAMEARLERQRQRLVKMEKEHWDNLEKEEERILDKLSAEKRKIERQKKCLDAERKELYYREEGEQRDMEIQKEKLEATEKRLLYKHALRQQRGAMRNMEMEEEWMDIKRRTESGKKVWLNNDATMEPISGIGRCCMDAEKTFSRKSKAGKGAEYEKQKHAVELSPSDSDDDPCDSDWEATPELRKSIHNTSGNTNVPAKSEEMNKDSAIKHDGSVPAMKENNVSDQDHTLLPLESPPAPITPQPQVYVTEMDQSDSKPSPLVERTEKIPENGEVMDKDIDIKHVKSVPARREQVLTTESEISEAAVEQEHEYSPGKSDGNDCQVKEAEIIPKHKSCDESKKDNTNVKMGELHSMLVDAKENAKKQAEHLDVDELIEGELKTMDKNEQARSSEKGPTIMMEQPTKKHETLSQEVENENNPQASPNPEPTPPQAQGSVTKMEQEESSSWDSNDSESKPSPLVEREEKILGKGEVMEAEALLLEVENDDNPQTNTTTQPPLINHNVTRPSPGDIEEKSPANPPAPMTPQAQGTVTKTEESQSKPSPLAEIKKIVVNGKGMHKDIDIENVESVPARKGQVLTIEGERREDAIEEGAEYSPWKGDENDSEMEEAEIIPKQKDCEENKKDNAKLKVGKLDRILTDAQENVKKYTELLDVDESIDEEQNTMGKNGQTRSSEKSPTIIMEQPPKKPEALLLEVRNDNNPEANIATQQPWKNDNLSSSSLGEIVGKPPASPAAPITPHVQGTISEEESESKPSPLVERKEKVLGIGKGMDKDESVESVSTRKGQIFTTEGERKGDSVEEDAEDSPWVRDGNDSEMEEVEEEDEEYSPWEGNENYCKVTAMDTNVLAGSSEKSTAIMMEQSPKKLETLSLEVENENYPQVSTNLAPTTPQAQGSVTKMEQEESSPLDSNDSESKPSPLVERKEKMLGKGEGMDKDADLKQDESVSLSKGQVLTAAVEKDAEHSPLESDENDSEEEEIEEEIEEELEEYCPSEGDGNGCEVTAEEDEKIMNDHMFKVHGMVSNIWDDAGQDLAAYLDLSSDEELELVEAEKPTKSSANCTIKQPIMQVVGGSTERSKNTPKAGKKDYVCTPSPTAMLGKTLTNQLAPMAPPQSNLVGNCILDKTLPIGLSKANPLPPISHPLSSMAVAGRALPPLKAVASDVDELVERKPLTMNTNGQEKRKDEMEENKLIHREEEKVKKLGVSASKGHVLTAAMEKDAEYSPWESDENDSEMEEIEEEIEEYCPLEGDRNGCEVIPEEEEKIKDHIHKKPSNQDEFDKELDELLKEMDWDSNTQGSTTQKSCKKVEVCSPLPKPLNKKPSEADTFDQELEDLLKDMDGDSDAQMSKNSLKPCNNDNVCTPSQRAAFEKPLTNLLAPKAPLQSKLVGNCTLDKTIPIGLSKANPLPPISHPLSSMAVAGRPLPPLKAVASDVDELVERKPRTMNTNGQEKRQDEVGENKLIHREEDKIKTQDKDCDKNKKDNMHMRARKVRSMPSDVGGDTKKQAYLDVDVDVDQFIEEELELMEKEKQAKPLSSMVVSRKALPPLKAKASVSHSSFFSANVGGQYRPSQIVMKDKPVIPSIQMEDNFDDEEDDIDYEEMMRETEETETRMREHRKNVK
ncbi:trichohyalin-like [Engraulis encrasicolus]|uniref:trichohyalin-like n=1 Tax=Engraulis encrasicolus TaxID=184585 RepID=UPI002FD581CB